MDAMKGTVFEYQARVGLTKHLGGIQATDELLALCHVSAESKVLDVGCGVGATPCYVARKYGCRVVGVDISAAMIARATERVQRKGLQDLVECRVADAQDLPFDDGTFDIVMTESVTVLPPDKKKAVGEYARVTRPGGYVGLNEMTWLKTPPSPEMVAYVTRDQSANAEVLSESGWVSLLEGAGLKEVVSRTHTIAARDETKGIVGRYGCGGMLGVLGRTLALYVKCPAYREFAKEIKGQSGLIPAGIFEYAGYGVFVGRK